MNAKYQINKGNSYKIGINEVVGLKAVMTDLMKPVQLALKKHIYWNECEIEETEYKSRDGFIPYSHNCGGVEIDLVIPECESSKFSYLEFGEDELDPETNEPYENEGELDARLRILFKFEGIDNETGALNFYVNVCGGNGDAPYFRLHSMADLYEGTFEAHSFDELQRNAQVHIAKIIRLIKAG